MRRTAWRASRLAGRRAGHTQSPCIGDGVAHYSGDLLICLYDIHLLAQAMSPAQWDEFLGLGYLDGCQGFAFHFLRGFWYRFPVDVKVHELETLMRVQGLTLGEAVRVYSGRGRPLPQGAMRMVTLWEHPQGVGRGCKAA